MQEKEVYEVLVEESMNFLSKRKTAAPNGAAAKHFCAVSVSESGNQDNIQLNALFFDESGIIVGSYKMPLLMTAWSWRRLGVTRMAAKLDIVLRGICDKIGLPIREGTPLYPEESIVFHLPIDWGKAKRYQKMRL